MNARGAWCAADTWIPTGQVDNEDGDNIYVAITNTLKLRARQDASSVMALLPLHKKNWTLANTTHNNSPVDHKR